MRQALRPAWSSSAARCAADLAAGLALLALRRYAEAEPLLEASHRTLAASAIRQPRLLEQSRAALQELRARTGSRRGPPRQADAA